MAGVTFNGVTKRYGDVTAVESLDLEVVDGEFMVLLGPSGCGKTTALRMIAGLESVSDGTLRIGDQIVNDVPASDRDIAMVFQSYALYPHMTVRKNIESPLVARRSTRLPPPERDQRVAEAAGILGLTEYLDRKPGALSGGQRQRVALARAIVRRPEVFLMDEPLSNLDAKLRTQTRAELVQLHETLGSTFVYVTHDQVEAMTMATRVAVIANGALQQSGTPEEVYDKPANLFVATFMGSPPMNVLHGQIATGTSGLEAQCSVGTIPLNSAASALGAGAQVTIGLRPEDLIIDPDGHLQMEVSLVEHLGHERHLHCSAGTTNVVLRQSSSEPSAAVGDRVSVRADSNRIHLFDPDTGNRIQ